MGFLDVPSFPGNSLFSGSPVNCPGKDAEKKGQGYRIKDG
jgi:hypothetical protein